MKHYPTHAFDRELVEGWIRSVGSAIQQQYIRRYSACHNNHAFVAGKEEVHNLR